MRESIFVTPYYRSPINAQLLHLSNHYSEDTMREVMTILQNYPTATIVTINDFALTITSNNGFLCTTHFLQTILDLEK
jgi:hypothetical protein